MPGLDAFASWGCCFCCLGTCLCVGGEDSEWSSLNWGYCGLHWFFGIVQVLSILLALPAIGVDFAHEFGIRGDKIIPLCADLLRAAEVSWVEVGDDSLSNMGYSSQVQHAQDVVCWRGGGRIQWTLRRCSWRQQGEGREDSRRIDCGLGGGGRHED